MTLDWLIAFIAAPAAVVFVSAVLVFMTGRSDRKYRDEQRRAELHRVANL